MLFAFEPRYSLRMPRIIFTGHLRRFIEVPDVEAGGATVRQALEGPFAANPRLRGYLLDDQGALRRHVAIYVGGRPLRDRLRLSDPVGGGEEIFVFQALSGG